MAKKKNIKNNPVDVLKKKIEQVKLEAHVDSVKKGIHTNFASELKYHANSLRSAVDKTIDWAKKEKLGKQTIKLLDTLIDGVAIFVSSLAKDKHE